MTPAWTVGAWPPVLWRPAAEPIPHFVHLGTHVSPRLAADWPRLGQTVWGGRAADAAAGVSWDWVEVAEGVLAVADPMMMVTNLRVLGADGEVLTAYEAAPHLNRIVNRLPWQAEVLAQLAALDDPQPHRWLPAPTPQLFGPRLRGTRRSDFAPLN
jgi:hypothetical protein